ncbi:hypothetical protein ACFX1X_021889 [Malus domestica]
MPGKEASTPATTTPPASPSSSVAGFHDNESDSERVESGVWVRKGLFKNLLKLLPRLNNMCKFSGKYKLASPVWQVCIPFEYVSY